MPLGIHEGRDAMTFNPLEFFLFFIAGLCVGVKVRDIIDAFTGQYRV